MNQQMQQRAMRFGVHDEHNKAKRRVYIIDADGNFFQMKPIYTIFRNLVKLFLS